MNKILVFEFIMGGGLHGQDSQDGFVSEKPSASLLAEADLMLRSVVRDLADIEGVEVWITRDQQFEDSNFPSNVQVHRVKENYAQEFRHLCEQVDAVLPIAPESDGVLELLNQIVVETGKVLLGSEPATVAICASKKATAEHLKKHQISVAETMIPDLEIPASQHGWIVKPDQGIGSEQVIFCESKVELKVALVTVKNPVLQPFIPGIPASLSLLCKEGECRVIGYNEQMVEYQHHDKSLRYLGSKINSLIKFKELLDRIADSVTQAFPGLFGYVGLDLILMQDKPVMIEINPRLTTSYSGLRKSIGKNPAALILDLCKENSLEDFHLYNPKVVDVFVPLPRDQGIV